MSEVIGKHLDIHGLKKLELPKVVCVRREPHKFWTTMWCLHVTDEYVCFGAQPAGFPVLFISTVCMDGKLADDSGYEIFVREYLAEA